jgi:hypothetical protein
MALRFGRRPTRHDRRTLRFAKYLTPALPSAPASCDQLARVIAALGRNDVGTLFPMLGNDAVGGSNLAGARDGRFRVPGGCSLLPALVKG